MFWLAVWAVVIVYVRGLVLLNANTTRHQDKTLTEHEVLGTISNSHHKTFELQWVSLLQWNLFIMVTLRPTKSGCYREVTC